MSYNYINNVYGEDTMINKINYTSYNNDIIYNNKYNNRYYNNPYNISTDTIMQYIGEKLNEICSIGYTARQKDNNDNRLRSELRRR